MSKNLVNKNKFPDIVFSDFDSLNPLVPLLKGIHIWKISISSMKNNLEFFNKLLSHDEYEKALKFKFEEDRLRALISRACLRILCGKYLSETPKDLIFNYSSKGKPFLLYDDFYFNVSHSKDIVLIGFSEFENFGVDVEYNRKMNDYMSIAEKYFHFKEYEFLKNLEKDKRKSFFLRYWTAKESYVKALGDGAGKNFNSFYIKGGLTENQFEKIYETDKKSGRPAFVYSFLPGANYFGAFCFKPGCPEIKS
jgi:4'-phosphopantetheinyl transferase